MPNTITQTTLVQGKRTFINYITLVSDGSEETDLLIFDSSVVYAAVGLTDTLSASIEKVWFTGSKTANAGTIVLEYDASTDVVAVPITNSVASNWLVMDFTDFGGLKNYAGSGKTGDVNLTTTGLDAGDSFIIVLQMRLA